MEILRELIAPQLLPYLNTVASFLVAFSFGLCIIGVIGGLITCFFGFKLHIFCIKLTGFIILGLITALNAIIFTQDQYIALAVFIIFGFVGASIALSIHRFMLFILGIKIGIVITLIVSILYGNISFAAFLIAPVIIGILTILLEKPVVIFTTSVGGSFTCVFCIAKLALIPVVDFSSFKGFQNSFTEYLLVLAISWFLLALIGMAIQFGLLRRKPTEEPDSTDEKTPETVQQKEETPKNIIEPVNEKPAIKKKSTGTGKCTCCLKKYDNSILFNTDIGKVCETCLRCANKLYHKNKPLTQVLIELKDFYKTSRIVPHRNPECGQNIIFKRRS